MDTSPHTIDLVLRVDGSALAVTQHRRVEVCDVVRVLHGARVLFAQHVDHLAGLEDVQLVQIGTHVVLHVFYHAANIGDVGFDVRHTGRLAGL